MIHATKNRRSFFRCRALAGHVSHLFLGTFFNVGDFSLFELTLRRGFPALVFGQYWGKKIDERRLLDTRPELAAGTRYIT
jgi:hypothetical protein